jgi:hypothetical protein
MMGDEDRDLLARITGQLDRCSAYQHRLARRARVLREAATMLRLGRPVALMKSHTVRSLRDQATRYADAAAISGQKWFAAWLEQVESRDTTGGGLVEESLAS